MGMTTTARPASFWQRGFNDGASEKAPDYPSKDGGFCLANKGYMNGYRAGQHHANATLFRKPGAKS
jgi:hypothetical protein